MGKSRRGGDIASRTVAARRILDEAVRQSIIGLYRGFDADLVCGSVLPVVDDLYDAYERRGIRPTKGRFCARCQDEGLCDIVSRMPTDPFAAHPRRLLAVQLVDRLKRQIG